MAVETEIVTVIATEVSVKNNSNMLKNNKLLYLSLQMTVVVLDPGIATIVRGQGPDLVIVKGGGHVIVIMTSDDHAPGHMIVMTREGDLVRDLENQSVHETLNHTCTQFLPS